jgi:LmbE family N-acetylglucosaminyl deacetylase
LPTLVSFHAHPDDEVLLTGGTLARAAREGHRVVLVLATDGGAGLTGRSYRSAATLAAIRRAETRAAATALGVARVAFLGYDDSGDDGNAGGNAFARCDINEAAAALAALLRAEQADVLTVYDSRGGYGHPDHVQVHHVGVRAAELAGTSVVLEATAERELLWRAGRLLSRLPGIPDDFGAIRIREGFAPAAAITHRVNVRRDIAAKRAAMAAHASQSSGPGQARTLAVFLRLPRPVFARAFGREWFIERGRTPAGRPLDDVFASLPRRAR